MVKKYIAPYILKSEYVCRHCGALPPGFEINNMSFIFCLLFGRFEKIRQQWGKPLDISSGYRCPTYQQSLWLSRASSSPLSVHIFGLAFDINVDTPDDVKSLVNIAEAIDPDLRIGYQEYLAKGNTFVHIDVGYLINPIFDTRLHEGARW